MDNKELFGAISRIAQGNIQEVIKPMLQRIIALEEALDAKDTAPEVVQEADSLYHEGIKVVETEFEDRIDEVEEKKKWDEMEEALETENGEDELLSNVKPETKDKE